MRNYKTTILGIIALIAGTLALALVYFDKASLTEAGGYLGLVLAFVMGVNGFLTKDHDKDNNAEVMADDPIGGGGIKNPPPKKD